MSPNIIQIKPSNRRQVNDFIHLPYRIYKDIPQWVPPLEINIRQMFKTSPFYDHSKAAFFLAYNQSGQTVGRIVVLDNHQYNQFNQTKTAFFYLFECENDQMVAAQLFEAALQWAKSHGLNRIYGPKGFSVMDGIGLLVEGFDHRPAFGLPYNPPYYADLIEANGFITEGELVSGYLDDKFHLPEKMEEISDLVINRRGIKIRNFHSRKELKAIIPKLKEVYNASLGSTTGNYPLSDAEIQTLSDQMLWFADPKLIKFVTKDDELVGFLLAYPDISAALQRSRGKLFPFGWLYMLLELRKTKWININGAAMMEGYRGLGGTAILFTEMYRSVTTTPYRYADLVQIGVENDKMQRELRDLGIDFYKKHRVYYREIT